MTKPTLASARWAIVATLVGLSAGCGATAVPATAPAFASLSVTLDVQASPARRVLAAPIWDVTASHVKTIVVTLTDTAPDGPAPSVATLRHGQGTPTVTFTHLKLGHFYQVTCRALGENPNGPNPADPTAELTDPDATLSTAFIDVPPLVNGVAAQNLTGRLTDAAKTPLAEQKLPLKLYTPIFRSRGESAIQVNSGGIANTTADVTGQ
ncbi:hypothetical protein D3C72_872460 [compost metagenome]